MGGGKGEEGMMLIMSYGAGTAEEERATKLSLA